MRTFGLADEAVELEEPAPDGVAHEPTYGVEGYTVEVSEAVALVRISTARPAGAA